MRLACHTTPILPWVLGLYFPSWLCFRQPSSFGCGADNTSEPWTLRPERRLVTLRDIGMEINPSAPETLAPLIHTKEHSYGRRKRKGTNRHVTPKQYRASHGFEGNAS